MIGIDEALKALLKTVERYQMILASNGIVSVRDFLNYFPRAYEDRSQLSLIGQLDPESRDTQSVVGQIIEKKVLPRGSKKLYEVIFQDVNEDTASILYFNTYFPVKNLIVGNRYVIIGKPKFEYRKRSFSHPQCTPTESPDTELVDLPGIGRIYPIYPELMGIKPSRFVKRFRSLLPRLPELVKEYLPNSFLTQFGLVDVVTMFHQMHFPTSMESLTEAKKRLYFDKLLRLQLYSLIKRREYGNNQTIIPGDDLSNDLSSGGDSVVNSASFGAECNVVERSHKKIIKDPSTSLGMTPNSKIYSLIKDFIAKLPFELTQAQKRCIKEMTDDMIQGNNPSGFATFTPGVFASQRPSREGQRTMMRLLQGDVGSGKTIVAAALAYIVVKHYKKQVVFLAPLSILAKQHYSSLAKLFLPLGITVDLLSGSRTKGHKDHLKTKAKDGHVDIIVATHAVLQEDVGFADLGLVVIDEQHKFGVRQRAFFAQHGYPHIIQMSATPIPRSMALAFFGEFDVSIIDELPAGRKAIQTKIMTPSEYPKLVPWIHDKLIKGQKLFVVAPLIEESEKMDNLHDVMSVYHDICELFAPYGTEYARIGLIHGRMKPSEKDQIMNDFASGEITILVSTTVIEVGVDIREATMMIIKNAERFGLAQLHQLRGRIGRNDLQSYCFLETKSKSGDSYERLQAMEQTNDGFKLAEIDLKFRGAGEVLGTRQSGEADIPPEIISDLRFIQKVREGAEQLLDQYPGLEGLSGLKKFVEQKMGDVIA